MTTCTSSFINWGAQYHHISVQMRVRREGVLRDQGVRDANNMEAA